MDDIPHASNAPEYLQATNYREAALYQNQPVVTDGNVITANSTASLSLPTISSNHLRTTHNIIYDRVEK